MHWNAFAFPITTKGFLSMQMLHCVSRSSLLPKQSKNGWSWDFFKLSKSPNGINIKFNFPQHPTGYNNFHVLETVWVSTSYSAFRRESFPILFWIRPQSICCSLSCCCIFLNALQVKRSTALLFKANYTKNLSNRYYKWIYHIQTINVYCFSVCNSMVRET